MSGLQGDPMHGVIARLHTPLDTCTDTPTTRPHLPANLLHAAFPLANLVSAQSSQAAPAPPDNECPQHQTQPFAWCPALMFVVLTRTTSHFHAENEKLSTQSSIVQMKQAVFVESVAESFTNRPEKQEQ